MKTIKMINQNEEQEQNIQQIKQIPNIKVKEYELVQVPTQHSLAVQTPEGEIITTEYAIVEILNKLTKMEKALIG